MSYTPWFWYKILYNHHSL